MGVCHFCALPTTSHVVSLQQDVKAGIISHMLLNDTSPRERWEKTVRLPAVRPEKSYLTSLRPMLSSLKRRKKRPPERVVGSKEVKIMTN